MMHVCMWMPVACHGLVDRSWIKGKSQECRFFRSILALTIIVLVATYYPERVIRNRSKTSNPDEWVCNPNMIHGASARQFNDRPCLTGLCLETMSELGSGLAGPNGT
jgi:hypothetical protein